MDQIKVTDILAAELKFNFDYERIKQEILSLKSDWIYTPPYKANLDIAKMGIVFLSDSNDLYNKIDYMDDNNQIVKRELTGQYVFYLSSHRENKTNNTKFAYTKHLDVDGWDWVDGYREKIPYTISCIESLPYSKLGLIRVFITENTFFPTHRDTNAGGPLIPSKNYNECLGISIIPDTGNVPMAIESFTTDEVYKISGNAMLFNDSAPHGVEFTSGIRITIRIFGTIDFQDLIPYIDKQQIYY